MTATKEKNKKLGYIFLLGALIVAVAIFLIVYFIDEDARSFSIDRVTIDLYLLPYIKVYHIGM